MRRTSVLVLGLALLAGCGTPTHRDANREVAKAKPEPSVNATVYPKPSPSPSPAPASGPSGATGPSAAPSAPPAAPGAVTAGADLHFAPGDITVKAGETVTWTNNGGTFHTVNGGKDGTNDSSSPINGTLPTDGSTYKVTFDKPGTYPYFCAPHVSVGMKGTVTVT